MSAYEEGEFDEAGPTQRFAAACLGMTFLGACPLLVLAHMRQPSNVANLPTASEEEEKVALEGEAEPALVRRLDTRALGGLRGLAVLHIAIGHYTLPLDLDLMGGASMGLFYALSGFVLTVGVPRVCSPATELRCRSLSRASQLGYGQSPLTRKGSPASGGIGFRSFMLRRWARIGPMYLLSNVAALLLSIGDEHLSPIDLSVQVSLHRPTPARQCTRSSTPHLNASGAADRLLPHLVVHRRGDEPIGS